MTYETNVESIMVYGAEAWSIKIQQQERLFEMKIVEISQVIQAGKNKE